MLIVYDKTQTMEKGLAGWPGLEDCAGNIINEKEYGRELWELLAPGQNAKVFQLSNSKEVSSFWNQLFMVCNSRESQYDILRRFSANCPSRQACLALEGTGFHGQRQRPWKALNGNLHLSLSIPLDRATGPGNLFWTMLPAVAIMRTVKSLGIDAECGIKWVNDVLVENRKLAGVISSLSISGNHIHHGFLGIGLNVACEPDIAAATCCLHQLYPTENIPLGLVLKVVLDSLARLITLFEEGAGDDIFQEYRNCSLIVGRRVQIVTDPVEGISEEICRGRVLAVNPDLSLILEGQKNPIQSGRLHFLN